MGGINFNRLGQWLGGLAVFAIVMAGFPASARAGGASAFVQIDLHANIETIGVVVSGSNLPAAAELWVRHTGEADWRSGHPLMRIDDGRLAGSLFGLAPGTSYDVRVVDGTDEISGAVTTQPEELLFTPAAIVYVSAAAPAGGDGSGAAPFRTIQEGVNHAAPGMQVLVADGVYHEAVTFPAGGSAGNWIQVRAQGSAAILDGSQNRSGSIWTRVTSVSHVYFTKLSPGATIAYLARDGQRFYAYDDQAGLNHGVGHGGVAMSEGWWFEASTLKLFVRSNDDPSGHSWQVPYLNHAFDIAGRDWIWIEGFEMRFYGTRTDGCGVCTLNASHVVIRRNKIHNLQLGVFFNWNGSDAQGNDVRIEDNEIYDPPVDGWPWQAVKGSSMEGTAIVLRGHRGAIVRGNDLHNAFNGIYVGSSAALENSALAFDGDIYNNLIHHIGDDALEPEGACINQRFRDNTVDAAFVGISLAPVTQGPTWVLRSTFTNFSGRGFKWADNSDGIVLIYHNTAWSNAANVNAMDLITPVHNATLRNNIFRSGGYNLYEVATGSTGQDWDHDDWYTSRTAPHFVWENVAYNTLADLCAGTGLECNGLDLAPGLVNPSGGDLTLLPTSPNIDAAVLIPGINDKFAGAAPDIGAYEYWPAHVFADLPVPGKEWMEPWVNAFYFSGITTGCGQNPLIYCPENNVTRAEMAVFLLRARHGAGYTPPPADHYFSDMPIAGKEWMEPWVDQYYREGLTTGCGGGNFCPENNVTRAEMAVFVLRALHPAGYQPPASTGYFIDVPVPGKEWMQPWIIDFYNHGITTGCGAGPIYCPENNVTRAEMAVFIGRAFGLDTP